ncbi:serine/threonine protein phosphatase [Arcobacter sp. HD9-500m-PIT-SAG03]|nr:serine/threonine protein phosphatase [Arcobacter sp. HD9-500m-PIT-SAG03]
MGKMKKNTYVIGDVHGCYNTLLKLVSKLPIDSDLIFVGDLCDKGMYSKEVIEFVINNNYRCIKGNHEHYMFLNIENALYRNIQSKWSTDSIRYGGPQTISNYKNDDKLLKKHLNWITKLPSYILIDKYFITHGYGLPYYQRRNECKSKKILLTNRLVNSKYEDDWEDVSENNIINIFGHCASDEVLIGKDYYGIDTGCIYGKKLTAIELGSMKIIQVNIEDAEICDGIIQDKSK